MKWNIKRLPRLSRGQKIMRNLLLCALLALLLWGVADYPLPTEELEFRRLERAYLMPPSEIIFNSEETFPTRRGQNLSGVWFPYPTFVGISGGYVCTGTLYSIDSRIERFPLGEGIAPVPMTNVVVTFFDVSGLDSGVPLMFLRVPEECRRAEIAVEAAGMNGEVLCGQGEGLYLAPGQWLFLLAPGDSYSGGWYMGGTYTLSLYREDGSLLLEQSGTLET